jgi:hypothetical protein
MKQPKFKFGEKVHFIKSNGEHPFVIDQIKWCKGPLSYRYSEDGYGGFEEDLELYQEPQKKKLYAYRVAGMMGEIKMFINELEWKIAEVNHLERAEDWDVEYPEITSK